MDFITAEVIYSLICLFIFDYRALIVRVKDSACPRIAITVFCANICTSLFGVLFCLLDRKLILGSKTI